MNEYAPADTEHDELAKKVRKPLHIVETSLSQTMSHGGGRGSFATVILSIEIDLIHNLLIILDTHGVPRLPWPHPPRLRVRDHESKWEYIHNQNFTP